MKRRRATPRSPSWSKILKKWQPSSTLKKLVSRFEDGSILKEVEVEEQVVIQGLIEDGATSETITEIKSLYNQMKEVARRNALNENILPPNIN